jgi:hypothetical protein
MPGGSEWILFFIIFLLLLKYIFQKGKNVEKNPPIKKSTNAIKLEIPDVCPICKNPNTKKIRLCEWCGSQIC